MANHEDNFTINLSGGFASAYRRSSRANGLVVVFKMPYLSSFSRCANSLASSAHTPWAVLLLGAACTFAAAHQIASVAGPEASFILETVVIVAVSGAAITLVLAGLAGLQAHARKQAELAWRRAETARAEAEASRDLAERTSRVKDEFLATISHELRTPLSAILGWAQLLQRSETTPEQFAQGLSVIERNAKAQSRIIADLLDMSRMMSGRLRLEMRSVDLTTVAAAATESAKPTAEAKGVAIEMVCRPGSATVKGDLLRLQQIAWNLVSNAVKFTPAGGRVLVQVERTGKSWSLSVADTGEGIDPAFLPHVFERFAQADGSKTRRHGGLGLGLAIVRHLTELHGGTTQVESAGINRGSTFTVSLPAADPISPGAATGTDIEKKSRGGALDGMTVLFVDDDADMRELIHNVLAQAGAHVVEATGAEQAYELLKQWRPDVLVGDIGMPGIDGFEMLRQVRARSELEGGATPAVALTAFAAEADRGKAIAAGFNDYVAKPAEPADLVAAVARVARRELASSISSATEVAIETAESSRRRRLGLDDE
jgi:signal transduction histidine kinase/DNA-binding NarL/FixJ family response regulator